MSDIVHMPSHQFIITAEAVGKLCADEEAKREAMDVGDSRSKEVEAVQIATIDLPIPELPVLPFLPSCTSEDLEWIQCLHLQETKLDNQYRDSEERPLLATELGEIFHHQLT